MIPGDYIAGFVDGEGCFYLNYRTEVKYDRINQPKYYRWIIYFAITLRPDDYEILEQIRNSLQCGKVYYTRDGSQAQFFIQNIDDLYTKVKLFFQEYPLRAKKRHDYMLWCEALEIIHGKKQSKEGYTNSDHGALLEIQNKMLSYKSKRNKQYKNTPILI